MLQLGYIRRLNNGPKQLATRCTCARATAITTTTMLTTTTTAITRAIGSQEDSVECLAGLG